MAFRWWVAWWQGRPRRGGTWHDRGARHAWPTGSAAWLARKLNAPSPGFRPYTHANVAALRRVLQPGDVLLVEGNTGSPRRSST